MGLQTVSAVDYEPPEKLTDFKKLAIAPEQFNIPELPQKREATDKFFLYGFLTSFFILFIFVGYTLCYSDLNRLLLGYDKCGNVCGVKNDDVAGINCSGKDMTQKTYLSYESGYIDVNDLSHEERHCSSYCDMKRNESESNKILSEFHTNRCFSNNEANKDVELYIATINMIIEIISQNADAFGKILLLTLIASGVSLFLFLAFKFATAATIWITLIVPAVVVFLFTVYVLVSAGINNELNFMTFLVCGIVQGTLILMLVIVVRRISFIIVIFKETVNAISSMPSIMLVPFSCFLIIFALIIIYYLLALQISTAGELTDIGNSFYDYNPDGAMLFSFIFSAFMFLWLWQFLLGCETVLISGAVSTWYFSRDKMFLGRPLWDSFTNLVKFHTGSVAFGSLVLTIFEIIRLIVKMMSRNSYLKVFADFCLGQIKLLLFYISKNAYIQTAMHGEGFYKSGKRAAQLLFYNLSEVIAVNLIGDFILFMAKLTVVVVTLLFGFKFLDTSKEFTAYILAISVLLSAALAHCVFKVFETTIDTIFLCYCEDCQLNDGIDHPYYMSQDLQKLFDESKSVLAPNNNGGQKDIADV